MLLLPRCQSAAINGLLFVPSGRRLVSSSQDDSLVLFDSELQVLKPLRTLGNTIAKPSLRIPRSVDALSLSDDGRTLAFIGPTPHIVTVAEALTLNEVTCKVQPKFSPLLQSLFYTFGSFYLFIYYLFLMQYHEIFLVLYISYYIVWRYLRFQISRT